MSRTLSTYDALVLEEGAVPPTRLAVRLFSSHIGDDIHINAGVHARLDTRACEFTEAEAVLDMRQPTLGSALCRSDHWLPATEAAGLSRHDARAQAYSDVDPRLTIRGASAADAMARFDYTKDPIQGSAQSRMATRQLVGSRNLSEWNIEKWITYAEVASRHSTRQGAIASVLARLIARAGQQAQVVSRLDLRGQATAEAQARMDGRATIATGPGSSARHDALLEFGWHVVARNVSSGVEAELGWVPATTAPPVLTDVSLADGVWEIEARPTEFFWDACRTRTITTVILDAGLVSIVGLPAIANLEAEQKGGSTFIRWAVAGSYALGAFTFGLWYSPTTPVIVSGEPDETKTYIPGQGDYLVIHAQTEAEYVAVAAYTNEDIGLPSEIELPWSGPLASPPDQHVT